MFGKNTGFPVAGKGIFFEKNGTIRRNSSVFLSIERALTFLRHPSNPLYVYSLTRESHEIYDRS